MNSSKAKKSNINSITPTANSTNGNFPQFLNKNYKSPSTEKLYSAIPKNLISNSKLGNNHLKKSPSLKITPKFEQQGNKLIENFLFIENNFYLFSKSTN